MNNTEADRNTQQKSHETNNLGTPRVPAREILWKIYNTRGIRTLPDPIWKLRISDYEYATLKSELKQAEEKGHLDIYSVEAAIYYAEWWRREYSGGFPSKEAVAASAGIQDHLALYRAARKAIEERKFKIFSVNHRREYFRTLLGQGGIPVNYVMSGSNYSNYSYFLRGLVRELSVINYDWNDRDSSIVTRLNCISRLPGSFQHESIFDISLQIAHAIISGDDSLLPYDSEDHSLTDLTNGLKKEYERAQNERHIRPLSIGWRLLLDEEDGRIELYYNLEHAKEVGSESLPGISPDKCFSFEVIIAGKVVAKYTRNKVEFNDMTGETVRAVYSKVNVGICATALWKGEQMVDVRIRCDDGTRLFPVISGSYPPDFSTPQSFQLLENNVYAQRNTANTDNNIAVFSENWNHPDARTATTCNGKVLFLHYSDTVSLSDTTTGEKVILENTYTPYSAVYSGTYLDWIEHSNYKLCAEKPRIIVLDKEKNPVARFESSYRAVGTAAWQPLKRCTCLPHGLVQIRVVFPDGHYDTETFYNIGKTRFTASGNTMNSSQISCNDCEWASVEMESSPSLAVTRQGRFEWKIERTAATSSPTCAFRFYKEGMSALRIELPLPFVGMCVINSAGERVPNKKIISYGNLLNFKIVCQGQSQPMLSVGYEMDSDSFVSQKIKCTIPDGITPLSDYSDVYNRLFDFYGLDSFSRKESVKLTVGDQTLYIRKFVLESHMVDGTVEIDDRTENQIKYPSESPQSSSWLYSGHVFAFPLSEALPAAQTDVFALERIQNSNRFTFPDDFPSEKAIVFSDIADPRKIVPKLYWLGDNDPIAVQLTIEQRKANREESIKRTRRSLDNQDIFTGEEWLRSFRCFHIASCYGLPFKTFSSLWVIGTCPELTAKFILGMWYHDNTGVLLQEISTFEQEFGIAIHWIRHDIWSKVIGNFFEYIYGKLPSVADFVSQKFSDDFIPVLRNLFAVTTGPETADELTRIVSQGMDAIQKRSPLTYSEINEIKSKVVGTTDTNRDLPYADIPVNGHYYNNHNMNYYYRMMLNTPICVAEYLCSVNGCLDLWAESNMEQRRIINFYRHYFRNQYSSIMLKIFGVIANR